MENSRRYCSVPKCKNYASRSKNISLHCFPRGNKILQEEWARILKIGKELTKNMCVCSDHFTPEDFSKNTWNPKKKFLKKGVLPSKKIPTITTTTTHQRYEFVATPAPFERLIQEGPMRNNVDVAKRDSTIEDPLDCSNLEIKQSVLMFTCTSRNAPGMYSCKKCEFRAYLKVNLKTHMEIMHRRQETTSIVDFCKISDTNYNLTDILKIYKCDKCDFHTFSALVHLKHTLGHETTTDGKCRTTNFICLKCSFTTKSQYSLHLHEHKSHKLLQPTDKEIQNRFQCKECEHKSASKGALARHVLRKHTRDEDIAWFSCDHCSFKTKDKYTLNFHEHHQHNSLAKWHVCKFCNFASKHKSTWRKHLVTMHLGTYVCKMCDFRCSTKPFLTRHMKNKHGGKSASFTIEGCDL